MASKNAEKEVDPDGAMVNSLMRNIELHEPFAIIVLRFQEVESQGINIILLGNNRDVAKCAKVPEFVEHFGVKKGAKNYGVYTLF
ncbi:hypothetical protein OROMI_001171 [Orobanche minor]